MKTLNAICAIICLVIMIVCFVQKDIYGMVAFGVLSLFNQNVVYNSGDHK